MDTMDLARNIGITEFSKITGVTATTLRDWNKRSLAPNLGQPGPNGHWLYAKTDAAKVRVAEILRHSGWNWSASLTAANAVVGHWEGRALGSGEPYYDHQYIVFVGAGPSELTAWGAGDTVDDAMAVARDCGNHIVFTPTAFVIDLEALSILLPAWMEEMLGLS